MKTENLWSSKWRIGWWHLQWMSRVIDFHCGKTKLFWWFLCLSTVIEWILGNETMISIEKSYFYLIVYITGNWVRPLVGQPTETSESLALVHALIDFGKRKNIENMQANGRKYWIHSAVTGTFIFGIQKE